MKIAFVSNYFNHHQRPLSNALFDLTCGDYYFISTATMSEERKKMGYGEENIPAYVKYTYTSEDEKEECQKIIDTADVVIIGSAPYSMIKTRLKKGLLTFIYTERTYKKGVPYLKLPLHFVRNFRKYIRFKNFYVLCASAYTPLDFSKTFSFVGKAYKWAYFTEVKKYDNIDDVISAKSKNSILWVARFVGLKHPEIAIEVARRLKADGYDFRLNMIGSGEREEYTRALVDSNGLSDCVKMLGSMKPTEVREHMENSEIFLFTSDKNEGWGAVLNESMNSACAVVANSAIGSVPFLIKDGENGYMYKDGDIDGLYNKVKQLLGDSENRKRMAKNAYLTMADEWNAENAAKKFVYICERITNGEYKPFPYEQGVCSKAKILKNNWMK